MTSPNLTAIWQQEPLAKFSVYTQVQIQHLWKLANEIKQTLDASVQDGIFYAGKENNLNRVYGDFWLWVLGAYEVVRTMSHYSTCFSESYSAEVVAFKKQIATLRMPFAKLQFQGSDKPINGEASIYSMDTEAKDLSFRIAEKIFSVRPLISEFERITKEVKLEDVLFDLRSAPARES
ncbi:hypothetical protein [Piscinibacter gummiphilus]|uniref:Uncharacterized protein n=1 Tax=Piscinibacter gummiphilus TaxID=946333 RepID=A0ABZ0CVH0_9BURK|nr:hypothetical protein [Piscinibacter gummiphilus]WOB06868.1 hypothetical protein RXV79_18320 [Piscinibacter gummiphilus]